MLLTAIRFLFITSSLFAAVKRLRWLVILLIVSQGFTAISYAQFGLPLNVAEFSGILLGVLIWRRILIDKINISARAGLIFVTLLLCYTLSGFYGIILLDAVDTSMLGFFQQPKIRFFSTLIINASLFSLLLLPALIPQVERKNFPKLLMITFVAATTLQCFVGLYDFIAARSPLPVIPTYGFASAEGFHALRSKGFVGEPRHLAAFIVPGLVAIIYARLIRLKDGGFLFSRRNLFLHVVVLLMTQSTSGLTMFLVSVSLIAFFSILRSSRAGRARLILYFAVAVPFVILSATMFFAEFMQDRLGARLTQESILHSEFNAAAANEFIARTPSAAIIGIGSGMSPYVIRDTVAFQDFVSVIESREGAIRPPPALYRVLLEGGLIAILVNIYILILAIRGMLWRNADYLNLTAVVVFANCVYSVVAGNAGAGFLVPVFWIGAGVLICYRTAAARASLTCDGAPPAGFARR